MVLIASHRSPLRDEPTRNSPAGLAVRANSTYPEQKHRLRRMGASGRGHSRSRTLLSAANFDRVPPLRQEFGRRHQSPALGEPNQVSSQSRERKPAPPPPTASVVVPLRPDSALRPTAHRWKSSLRVGSA